MNNVNWDVIVPSAIAGLHIIVVLLSMLYLQNINLL